MSVSEPSGDGDCATMDEADTLPFETGISASSADHEPRTCRELLRDFKRMAQPTGSFLNFEGIEGCDAYNPTRPFNVGGETYIAARVEPPESELDSMTMFFRKNGHGWMPDEDAPVLELQDPAIARVGDRIVLAGVRVFPEPTKHDPDAIGYNMAFFEGRELGDLRYGQFAEGPKGMKGIRLLEMRDGSICFSNKMEEERRVSGGRYTYTKNIGFGSIKSLKDLNEDTILNADVITGMFAPDEWGGVNELYDLGGGRIGVLGHVAYESGGIGDERKYYYTCCFVFDLKTWQVVSPVRIIGARSDFPENGGSKIIPGKRKDFLEDIVYAGGAIRYRRAGVMDVYLGASDKRSGCERVTDYFSRFEVV